MNISVSVSDGTNPIGQVSVKIADTNSNEYSGTTGNAGGCTLSNVPIGSYTVTATKEGYDDYSDTLEVTEDTKTLSIEMNETQGG